MTASAEKMKTVLIVDDETDLTEVIAFHLEHLGLHTVVAHSGSEALQVYRSQPVDLVISDVRMPKGDGIEFLTRVKADNASIPVVLISGFADIMEEEAKRLGAVALLSKPMGLSEIAEHVQKALNI